MLQVKDLAYRYKGAQKASLLGVDLSVERGQVLACSVQMARAKPR